MRKACHRTMQNPHAGVGRLKAQRLGEPVYKVHHRCAGVGMMPHRFIEPITEASFQCANYFSEGRFASRTGKLERLNEKAGRNRPCSTFEGSRPIVRTARNR